MKPTRRAADGRRVGPAPGLATRRDRKIGALLRFAGRAGVSTRDAHLIWDFTVGSERSLQERLLKIRNDAFAQLGDRNLADLTVEGATPAFEVGAVEEFTPDQNAELLRRVTGTFTVPCYLTSAGCAPGGASTSAPTGCRLSRPATSSRRASSASCPARRRSPPGRASLFGHGLLGSAEEATTRLRPGSAVLRRQLAGRTGSTCPEEARGLVNA